MTRSAIEIPGPPAAIPRCRAGRRIGVLAALVLALGCAEIRGAQLYDRGTLALDRGDAAAAVRELEAAARLVPQASEIQNHLGLAYLASGRAEEARAAFERALELDCDNRAAQANLLALGEGSSGGRDREPAMREASPTTSDMHANPGPGMPEISDGR